MISFRPTDESQIAPPKLNLNLALFLICSIGHIFRFTGDLEGFGMRAFIRWSRQFCVYLPKYFMLITQL